MVLSRKASRTLSNPPSSPTLPPQLPDELNVRLIFEKYALDEVTGIHRRVNADVERKKEELRMLVG